MSVTDKARHNITSFKCDVVTETRGDNITSNMRNDDDFKVRDVTERHADYISMRTCNGLSMRGAPKWNGPRPFGKKPPPCEHCVARFPDRHESCVVAGYYTVTTQEGQFHLCAECHENYKRGCYRKKKNQCQICGTEFATTRKDAKILVKCLPAEGAPRRSGPFAQRDTC